jgi:hypothetical protein
MENCDIWGLVKLLGHIDDARCSVKGWAESEDRDELVSEDGLELYVTGNLLLAQHYANQMRLQATHDRVYHGGGPFYFLSTRLTWQQLSSELTVLRQAIEADLEKLLFIQVAPEKATLVNQLNREWDKVWESIPEARIDIEEAVSCYALERNTASVFHSMRVAERGLRGIARELKVKLTDKGKPVEIETGTWGKVLAQIRHKLQAEHQKAATKGREAQLRFYSQVADHCEYMRDIWRNEVSHAGRPYDEGEALGALNRVREFMLSLVKGMKTKA